MMVPEVDKRILNVIECRWMNVHLHAFYAQIKHCPGVKVNT